MPPNDQRIEPLNRAEFAWVRDELANAQARRIALLTRMLPTSSRRKFSTRRMPLPTTPRPRPMPNYANAVINAIGIAFGQHLVDTLGFQWCAVSDSHGQELAVVALPDTAKVLVFPPNLVAKRWESGTTDFLGYIYTGIKDDLDNFRTHWEQQEQSALSPTSPPTGFSSWLRRILQRMVSK